LGVRPPPPNTTTPNPQSPIPNGKFYLNYLNI